jgi:tRNA-specific 2-thiouridylase
MDIAVLLSGGVDSSVVVHRLCESGHKPALFYIKIGTDKDKELGCSAEEDIEISRLIARKYGLRFEIVDLHKQYWDKVISYVVEKASQGKTPNPDVMCNKLIKFGCFEEYAGCHFEKIATGHYATIRTINDKVWLGTAKDVWKDQTDFLSQLNYSQLSKLMFPVGYLLKEEVRALAASAGLPSARRRDSQGICFLGKISYNDLLRRYLGEKKGAIIEKGTGKILGTHKGYWFHTIGQRKGLGLAGGPWYVVEKGIKDNIVYVSNGNNASPRYGKRFIMHDFHFITLDPGFSVLPAEITFKIRHCEEFIHGNIMATANGFVVESSREIQGIAPGQFGVIYDNKAEICFGSGEIGIL